MDTQVKIDLQGQDELLEDVEEDEPRSRGDKRTKGRGFKSDADMDVSERYSGKGGEFEHLDDGTKAGPLRSIEGWIIFVTGIHEEATEDDLHDKFSDIGFVKNIQLPLDRRTGFVKGYALIEYESKGEAERAIKELDNSEFMEHTLYVDWAFSKGATQSRDRKRTTGGRGERKYERREKA